MKKEVIQGKKVERFTLTNQQQTKVTVLTLGGIIQEFSILNDGKRQNTVVNFENAQDYVDNPYQICKQIGRIAGRIHDGRFELAGQEIQVPINENHNTLHGGDNGIGTQVFDGYQVADNEVILSLNLDYPMDGFPGEMTLQIDYLLHDDNRLDVTYDIVAKSNTVYDPTIHIYWALPTGLKDTTIKINGSQILDVDEEKIPTGKLLDVKQTAYDFTTAQNLADAVEKLRSSENQKGFDTAYQVQESLTEPVVEIDEKESHVKIRVFSDRNGLVIFTADPKNSENDQQGVFNSLATEVQTLPDALHHDEFGNVRLMAGEHKSIKIAYQVETY
ncbi:aldose epimerase family protein [Ligilactobacillus sp. LYQ135]